jgi:hypothetical protein
MHTPHRHEQKHWCVREFDVSNFEHPESEQEIVDLIRRARAEGAQVRVRGSEHSVAKAVYTDHFDPVAGASESPRPVINVMMDRYRGMEIRERPDGPVAIIEAGRSIGGDPYGPAGTEDPEQSVVVPLHRAGYALPILGGITHQTISGFLGTGSAGASVMHNLSDAIVSVRLIDGTGQVHDVDRDHPWWPAIGTSMGLYGIISTVTLKLVPRYAIEGWTSTQHTSDCEIDLFGSGSVGRPSLKHFFEREPYSRLMWWPQRGVNKVEIWRAEPIPWSDDFEPKPFRQFPLFPRLQQRFIRAIYRRFLPAFERLAGRAATTSEPDQRGKKPGLFRRLAGALYRWLLPWVINLFIPCNVDRSGRYEHRPFQDVWYEGLPHDNQMDDQLMPILFTEVWIDLEQAPAVMRALRDYWAEGSLARTGTFCAEIYATGPSPFWLNAAYGRAVLRFDPFMFHTDDAKPDKTHFPQFWELLRQFGFRFHWGKSLSEPESSTGPQYRREVAGADVWDRFLLHRQTADPDGIFVTEYWRRHLGL